MDLSVARQAIALVREIEFTNFVFQGVLSFLLFAGALGMNSHALWQVRGLVVSFALISTLVSTFVVGALTFGLLRLFGIDVSWLYALLFGALISPTDLVAVLAILKQARVPRRIETLMAGESLFTDGVGVVAFVVLASLAGGAHENAGGMSPLNVARNFA
ncbi:cation:proton antiporter [Deinococcus yavapaiensis]|uniref:cation:proton antiporter domain-containing protein n=1 Tax=Deinococcus yavapaiensis TaxID=309889 RepID=UPI0014746419|nr:cation:proton antiporter [Deinococcus yavapaiensis]